MVRTLTDEAALLLLFINLDGPGHPYCESPFSIIHLTKKVGNVEWSSEARSALEASEAPSPESAGVESDSSMGAATKAIVF